MRSDKRTRAMQEYDGFQGTQTVEHVMSSIPDSLCDDLTGRQVGKVMSIRNAAYQEGKRALDGIDLCDDCVWLPWGGTEGNGQLVPVEALKRITSETTDKGTTYRLEYTEPKPY